MGPSAGPSGFEFGTVVTFEPRIELSDVALRAARLGTEAGKDVAASGGPADQDITWEVLEEIIPQVFEPARPDPEREIWQDIIRRPVGPPDPPFVRPTPEYPVSGEGTFDKPGEERTMADWGTILGGAARGAIDAVFPRGEWDPFATLPGIAGSIFTGAVAPTPNVPSTMVGTPTMQPPNCEARTVPGPRYLTYDCRTGQFIPKRRRRRRRLLTPTDLSDLAALAGVVGKGSQGMQVAVARAVGGGR